MVTSTERRSAFYRGLTAAALALCVGTIMVAPFVYFAHDPAYRGIEMLGPDAQDHYVARVEQVYAGHSSLSNTFMPWKGGAYAIPPLGENIVAGIGKIFHTTAVGADMVSKFLLPLLVTLLVYVLGYLLFGSQGAALLGALSVMLGTDLMSVSEWTALLHNTSTQHGFLMFSRPINPEVSAIFLFGALITLYCAWFHKREPAWWQDVLLGVLVGASLYVSPFIFSFLGIALFLAFVWFAVRREWMLAMHALVSGVLALLVLVPFVLNYMHLHKSPWYALLAMKQGIVHSHMMVVGALLPLMAIALIFLWPARYAQSARIFLGLCITSLLVVLNQQAVTGMLLQPGHYHWYITKPLAGLMFGAYLWWGISHLYSRWRTAVLVVIVSVFVYHAVLVQVVSYRAHYADAVQAQEYTSLISYLNTMPEQTIWTDATSSIYIPMYTVHNAPNNPYAAYYLNPQSIYEDQIFLRYRLQGVTPSTIGTALRNDQDAVLTDLYGMYWREAWGGYGAMPENIIADLVQKYSTFYARPYSDVFRELGITMLIEPATMPLETMMPHAVRLDTTIGTNAVYSVTSSGV